MSPPSSEADFFDGTIVAVITPPGEGGIAALRLAGKKSLTYLQKHFIPASKESKATPFLMRYGHFVDRTGAVIDEVTAVYMPKGKSYTGLEQVEIFCHGGRQVINRIMEELIASGARAAEPGEFTKLAFLSGRIDLAKAEAVAEIIGANTSVAYRTAREHLLGAYSEHINLLRSNIVKILSEIEASIDFPEEDIETVQSPKLLRQLDKLIENITELVESYQGGRIIKEGFTVAIAGRPNAGKSSLFNLLLRQERALVTPTAGTTRDYLSEWIELGGVAVNLIDTAGLRKKGGAIEKAGQAQAKQLLKRADLRLWIIDLSEKNWEEKLAEDLPAIPSRERTPQGTSSVEHDILLVGNKIDLLCNVRAMLPRLRAHHIVPISCKTKKGIKSLKKSLIERIDARMPDLTSGLVVTSARHRQKLQAALKSLHRAKRMIKAGESPEIPAFELRQAASAIDEITGKVYTEDILEQIFSTFCIGK